MLGICLIYFLNLFSKVFLFLQKISRWVCDVYTSNSKIMDVTRSNFEDVVPKVKKSFEEATFITIDCEMTGLNTISNINAFDTISQYYNKVKRSCREFLVIQYGISAFRYDKTANTFKQSSYNFYIFRRPVNRNIPDQRFLCQTSSIEFLISQGFDFNKLFKEGIPYLNLEEETKYQDNIEEKKKSLQSTNASTINNDRVAIPPLDQPFIDEIMKSIKEYLESGDKEPLQLPKCNPFLRKLIYQTTAELFSDKIIVETKQLENKDRILFVSKVKSKEELELLAKQKIDEEYKVFNESVGFTKVLRMIVNSGKLVVGHNLVLDLLHTIDKFLTLLPEDYEDFKECAHGLFNNILDTKFMCSSDYFKDLINSSVLGHLLDSVKQSPFSIPKVDIENGSQGYTLEDKREHEAAFDAYITGISFLAMWNHLGSLRNLSPEETFSNFDLLKPFMNKIYLMRLQDNQFIHLGGVDPKPPRDHVFHISFPQDWKNNEIQQFFSPFGNVFISWINDTSAFVGLYKRDQADLAYTSLVGDSRCIITRYSDHYNDSLQDSSSQSFRRRDSENVTQNLKKRKISSESPKTGPSSEQTKKKKSTVIANTFNVSDAWD